VRRLLARGQRRLRERARCKREIQIQI
jgi:hypothetical protein